MEAFADWTAVFIVNAAWQIPTIAVASFAALRLIGRPHPQVEHTIWISALAASVVLPAWAASRAVGGRSAQVTVDAPWLAAELLGFAFWASVAVGVFLFVRSWNHVRWLKRLPAEAAPSDRLLQITEGCARALVIPTPQLKICDVPAPATVGGARPVVLLPRSFAAQRGEAMLRAAVAHEAAHIARKDFRVNFWIELLSIAVAAHPVTHWMKTRLKASREKACDAVVAERVLNSREYARSVLHLAASLGAKGEVRLAPGVLDGGDLASRMRSLLDRRAYATSMASRCVLALTAAAFLLTGWHSAQWLRPRMPELSLVPPKPPPPPPSPREIKRRLSNANRQNRR